MAEYSNDTNLTCMKDVETFFHHIVFERRVNFHPDDSFSEYVNYETQEPSFTKEEVMVYDRLMDEAFAVCEKAGADIYGIGLQELQSTLGFRNA